MVNIKYNRTGDERKALVKAISEVLGVDAVYDGAPTFTFTVGGYKIDPNGAVSYPDDTNPEEVDRLITALKERGFEADMPDSAVSDDSHKLVIEVPSEGFSDEALENLRKIIASKSTLIRKAIGLERSPIDPESLSFETKEDRLCFPWFTVTGADGEADAYTQFVYAMCDMAKKQKRVTAKEQESWTNDKFAMRIFLIRLGFVGSEFKAARHILLKNLTGNSSWKNGRRPEKTTENEADNASNTPTSDDTMEV